jgi:predicted RNA-binding Zn ribbon-like protein
VLAVDFIDPLAGPDLRDGAATAAWLRARGIRGEPDSEDLAALAGLQAAVGSLLRSRASGQPPTAPAIEYLNACSAGAAVAPQLNWPPNGRPRMWLSSGGGAGAHVLGTVARSAIDLLAGDGDRLRVCEAHGCDRVFLTTSARRRWCSDVCGNRVRVARHAARRRTADRTR